MNVVYLWKQGKTTEQIREEYTDLSFAQIHAALTYYYDHPEEIEASLNAEEGWQGAVRAPQGRSARPAVRQVVAGRFPIYADADVRGPPIKALKKAGWEPKR